MPVDTETLIIGGSASGLATAAALAAAGRTFEVLEATDVVGTAWRHHYDRLHLHTPKSSSALPGLPMPSAWPRYPSRDQVVDLSRRYRAVHGIEPHYGQDVTRLERVDGCWTATTATRTWTAPNVVVATGATRRPVRPTWPGMQDYAGEILHSSEYRQRRALARTAPCSSSASATRRASRRSTSWSMASRRTCRSVAQ